VNTQIRNTQLNKSTRKEPRAHGKLGSFKCNLTRFRFNVCWGATPTAGETISSNLSRMEPCRRSNDSRVSSFIVTPLGRAIAGGEGGERVRRPQLIFPFLLSLPHWNLQQAVIMVATIQQSKRSVNHSADYYNCQQTSDIERRYTSHCGSNWHVSKWCNLRMEFQCRITCELKFIFLRATPWLWQRWPQSYFQAAILLLFPNFLKSGSGSDILFQPRQPAIQPKLSNVCT